MKRAIVTLVCVLGLLLAITALNLLTSWLDTFLAGKLINLVLFFILLGWTARVIWQILGDQE